MDTIFTNSENSKTSKTRVLIHNLTDKIDLRDEKSIILSNHSIYYASKNIKSLYNKKFTILAPTWNDIFELPDGPYSISYIQDHF